MKEDKYHYRIKSDDFFDEDFKRTKHYTEAIWIMRRFHSTLEKTSDTWNKFNVHEFSMLQCSHREVDTVWGRFRSDINEQIAELHGYQRTLAQKIQTFDRMLNGVRSRSLLRTVLPDTDQR